MVSADSYATTVDTRQLGSTTINLVQGQIDHAVTRGSNVAALQPGMIRTFDDKEIWRSLTSSTQPLS